MKRKKKKKTTIKLIAISQAVNFLLHGIPDLLGALFDINFSGTIMIFKTADHLIFQ